MTLPGLARGRKFWKIQNAFLLCLTHIRSAGSPHAFHWASEYLQVCLAWLQMVQIPARRRAAVHGNSTATPHLTMIWREDMLYRALFFIILKISLFFFYYLHWFSKPVWAKWLCLYFLKIKTEHSCVLRYIPQNSQSLSLVPLESLLTPQALTHALSLYTVFSLLTSASAPYSSPLGKTKGNRESGWHGESERWNLSAP